MPDREKYIEALSKTAKAVKELNEDAPIKISLKCIEDILELLKEQEAKTQGADSGMCEICSFYERAMPVKPEREHSGSGVTWWNVCGNCKTAINPNDKFCHECGRPVLWEGLRS